MNFAGFALVPMALEVQMPVSDPVVIFTRGATVEELTSQGLIRTVWLFPGSPQGHS